MSMGDYQFSETIAPLINQQGFKNQKSWYMFFCAPNNMFAYTFVHLTFCAPQTVVRGRMDAWTLTCTYTKTKIFQTKTGIEITVGHLSNPEILKMSGRAITIYLSRNCHLTKVDVIIHRAHYSSRFNFTVSSHFLFLHS